MSSSKHDDSFSDPIDATQPSIPATEPTSTQYTLSHPSTSRTPSPTSWPGVQRDERDDDLHSETEGEAVNVPDFIPRVHISSPSSASGSRTSFHSTSRLEVPHKSFGGQDDDADEALDDEGDDPDVDLDEFDLDLEDEVDMFLEENDLESDGFAGVGEPLVSRGSRARGRRRRRWNSEEEKQEKGLLELIPPLVLAHPLALLPLLALLPYNFLPAGVVFFIPIFCVLAVLSACAHIVIVYLAWYLKATSFEEVFAVVTAKYGKYGLWTGRAFVVCAVLGAVVSWLETLYPLLQPVIETYISSSGFWSSKALWTVLASATLLPSLLPSRMTRSLRRSPIVLALLLPVVAFLIIGRTVEIKKASELPQPIGEDTDVAEAATEILGHLAKRRFGLAGGSSAGAGLTTLTIFLSPHINTLPIHATLIRNKRSSFPIPCLITAASILALCLPLALVPYYLLPALDVDAPTPTTPSGVFGRLPPDDGWVNLARVLMCAVALGSSNMWILRGRDTILKAMGVDHGEREKAGRWVGVAMWSVMVLLACVGGWLAEKVELLGVLAILAIGWFLPSLFFIITFHVRSPLSIIFPSTNRQPDPGSAPVTPARRGGHNRTDSLNDPTTDALLAKKEQQLQKRRLGRRLWQDLIVYVGILPVGCITIAWTLGRFFGIW
ncbi:hypothetical protein IAU60_000310 [Kwoniella sp. DSM 27419]